MTAGNLTTELSVPMVYGQALLEAARQTDTLPQVLTEAGELSELLRREPQLFSLISTPVIPAGKRKQAIGAILEGRISQELVNLLYVMIDKGRGASIFSVLHRFEELVSEAQGVARGTVVSARALTGEEIEAFEGETARLVNKKVRLVNQVEPRVLGGVRILIDGKVIDATVESRLAELAKRLI